MNFLAKNYYAKINLSIFALSLILNFFTTQSLKQ